MADSEKRISFRGVDQGAGDMMSKLRQKSQELGQSMIENTRRVSGSSKDFIQNLREQISLEEKRIRLREQSQKFEAEQRYQRESESPDFSVRSQAKEKYQESVQQIEGESDQEKLQTELLRELVEETKQQAREEVAQDREQVEKDLGMKSRGFFTGKEAKEPETEEEALKQSYQRQIIKDEKQETALDNIRGKAESAASSFTNPMAALASLPVFGGIAAYMASTGNQYQVQGGRMQATTGRDYMGTPMNQLADFGITNREIFDYRQNFARSRGFGMQGRNDRRYFNGEVYEMNEAERAMITEKAGGLQQGTLANMAQYETLDTSGRKTSGDVLNLINTMRSRGELFTGDKDKIDFSRLADLMETQNELASQQSQYLSNIDMTTNANILSAFQDIGGVFGSPATQREMVTGMSEAFRTKGNQFTQAFKYRNIRNLNPNADYYDVQMAQAQGMAYSPDEADGRTLVGETLRNVDTGGKMGIVRAKQYLESEGMDITMPQATDLMEAFRNNPDMFRGLKSEKDIREQVDKVTMQDMLERAGKATGSIDKLMAHITGMAGKGGASVMDKLENMINKVDKHGLQPSIEAALYNWSNGWLGSRLPQGQTLTEAMKQFKKRHKGLSKETLRNAYNVDKGTIKEVMHKVWGDHPKYNGKYSPDKGE